MAKKYIIELEENEHLYKTEMVLGEPVLCSVLAEPYTVPDLERVRDEAFKNGYDAACKDIDIKSKTNAAYRKGLEDSWEAARKIDGMTATAFHDCFLEGYDMGILYKYTAAEAIEKIKQYEQEQEGFHVGDEFENETGKKFVVLKMNGSEIDRYIDSDGQTYHMNVKYKVMRKTGCYFPEITTFFKKMRGE